ncbi:MAG: hypothetical protein VB099_03250 [Candidatus Limiplasma sp.]|nr:hypothetical protein [Candidatus Limiplasma sp.]
MDAITVKVSALLVMVQALAHGGMDYVTLSTRPLPGGLCGHLYFEAYRKDDPALALLILQAPGPAPAPEAFDANAARTMLRTLQ